MRTSCEQCGERLVMPARGRSPRFCSTRCRVAAHRARKSAAPAVMVDAVRWVRAEGKRPIRPNGRPASSTNPGTWSTFAAVQSGAGDGFGFMLGGGIGCWDLDDCLDGDVLAPWAVEVVASIASPLHVERSASGRGLHIFVRADEGPGRRDGNIEFYSGARFIRSGESVNWSTFHKEV